MSIISDVIEIQANTNIEELVNRIIELEKLQSKKDVICPHIKKFKFCSGDFDDCKTCEEHQWKTRKEELLTEYKISQKE